MQNRALSQPQDPARTHWSLRMADSALKRYSLREGQWHYKDGLLFMGVYHAWRKTGERAYWQQVEAYIDRYVDAAGMIDTYAIEDFNLDQINFGKLLFALY